MSPMISFWKKNTDVFFFFLDITTFKLNTKKETCYAGFLNNAPSAIHVPKTQFIL